jgi:hypothetical protein
MCLCTSVGVAKSSSQVVFSSSYMEIHLPPSRLGINPPNVSNMLPPPPFLLCVYVFLCAFVCVCLSLKFLLPIEAMFQLSEG